MSDRCSRPVDAADLAVVRAAFGAILAWQAWRFLGSGWLAEHYLEPSFHFTYAGFRWVRPWPGLGLYLHVAALGLCALALCVGWRPRLMAGLCCLLFSYVFLLEKARYLNHFYLVIVVCGLLAVVPCGSAWSLDALRRARAGPHPAPPASVPAWCVGLLRAQVGLVYLLAGVAKLNPDWLAARPLDDWLLARADHPVLGPLLAHAWAPWVFSYGGLLLDLGAWPLLALRRTRGAAFLLVSAFHLTNAALFNIGIFPWTMIALTSVFFEPDWPRRLLGRWLGRVQLPLAPPLALPARAPVWRRRLVLAGLLLWLAFQALFPLRHLLYPGEVSWTEEGHAFSWHMKLRSKHGELSFVVADPATGEEWLVDPAVELRDWQVDKMCGRPDMVLEYAQHVGRRLAAQGRPGVEVRAHVVVSLNGHPFQQLVDPRVDLMHVHWGWQPADWIMPLAPRTRGELPD